MIELEDTFADVLSKAAAGRRLSASDLAKETGLDAGRVENVLAGVIDDETIQTLAPVLGLRTSALMRLARGEYRAAPVEVAGIRQFTTSYGDMLVNSYLLRDEASGEAAVFDTGSDVGEILDAVAMNGDRISQVFITHAHGDHVFDLDRLLEKSRATAWTPMGEDLDGIQTFEAGRKFRLGSLSIETRLTRGHAVAGVTYVIHGLSVPVAVCGDAIFAGSMGGGRVSYVDALRTNREEIFSLPDETVLCPGHGPMTTVGEQRVANPFFSR